MGQGKGKPSLLNGNRIHQIQHDPVDPHTDCSMVRRFSCIAEEIQRLFLVRARGVLQRWREWNSVFNPAATVVRKVDFGTFMGAQLQILFLPEELLLIIFLQMKIENTVADNTFTETNVKNICRSASVKREFVSENGTQSDTVLYMDNLSSRETIRARLFSSINTVKNNSKHKECRHAAGNRRW